MMPRQDLMRVQEELVQAVKQGDEARARVLVLQLGAGPRQVRAALEAMLEDSRGLVRQAAAFGLGELGGPASVRRLEQQLAQEEARGDYDGNAVAEDITQALGRIQGARARTSLVRRLEKLVAGKPQRSEVNAIACALWRQRHPELISPVRQSIARLSLAEPHSLNGLLVLLEKSPAELAAWARDPGISLSFKTRLLAVLEEDVPDAWQVVLAAFVAMAREVSEQGRLRERDAESYCERLFSLLLGERDRLLTAMPEESLSALRTISLKMIADTFPSPSLWAAVMLTAVGRPEDAALVEAHCPAEPVFAKVFIDAAQTLRKLQRN
jgi:HEAT repeat protein